MMEMRPHKLPAPDTGVYDIMLPIGSTIMSLDLDDRWPLVWVLQPKGDKPKIVPYKIALIRGEGGNIGGAIGYAPRFIGTARRADFVCHVWDLTDPGPIPL